jgi:signal transduction histidine kinase
MMPGINGFETCERLKANEITADIPVIFMTALTEENDKVRGFHVGAVDYLTKPIQQQEAIARVMTHLRIQEQAKKLRDQNVRLQDLTAELAMLNTNKDKFFSIVAHDLRGPFLPLLGNALLLSDMVETLSVEDIREMSGSIARGAQRVMDLLDNLLKWSRIQIGRMEYNPTWLDLQGIVEKNVKLLTPNARNKEITLHNNIVDNLSVYADKNMLDTAIRNLISNALKFSSQGGRVTILAETKKHGEVKDGVVEISIIDTGIGISKENVDKLFRIDMQYTTPGTAQETGSGLGLIMCKEMVEMNGGKIWLESELRQGTTVKFTVPVDNSRKFVAQSLDCV